MTSRTIETSPQFYARIAGILYMIIIAGGLFAEVFVREQLVDFRNPASTAANIISQEMRYRAGFAAHAVILLSAVAVLYILYLLLKRVNRNLALLMVLYNIVSIAIEGASLLGHFAPLILIKSGNQSGALNHEQLRALVNVPLRLQSAGYDLGLVFFGFFCIFAGYLIYKSTFLPRILGILMIIAGICYPVNSFINFLAPQYSLFPYILVPCLAAEAALSIWLIVKGVDVLRWQQIGNLSLREGSNKSF